MIFVEVALMPSIAREVSGLLNKDAPVGDPRTFKAAIFYSIINCQPGLKGVSMGNFLIKRVAEISQICPKAAISMCLDTKPQR